MQDITMDYPACVYEDETYGETLEILACCGHYAFSVTIYNDQFAECACLYI